MNIIVYGSRACGKTHNADKLRVKYSCETIIDEWSGEKVVGDKILILTNLMPNSVLIKMKGWKNKNNFSFIPFKIAIKNIIEIKVQ